MPSCFIHRKRQSFQSGGLRQGLQKGVLAPHKYEDLEAHLHLKKIKCCNLWNLGYYGRLQTIEDILA